ncbi:hypothetical protein BLNAU_9726 [Blattamonas nauphoetae]|uniref:Uncharacterized protein n=1 Tax=Blattamonas nauphoetae TaxID=2049346 RepID=A0ABQ9XV29_9EUKA|nr:hypothetical protein BLNAU_9726 [Blattamonas nauphoetae]
MQISKQILQYELKRKQINVESMMKQALLEGDEIRLPTSTSSDWRLALQDSVTTDDLRQGCLSLFERVNSKVKLIPIEVYHAVHFLEYATIRTKHREFPQKALLEVIFPEEFKCPTKLTSSLINLVCHPSDTLRTAALSFFAIGLSTSSQKFSLAVIATRLLPQLFQSLKPDEIPINGTTIDFHRHITSIVGTFLNCSPLEILGHLNAKSIS